MNRRELKTLIHSVYKQFAKEHAFTFLKPTLLVRLEEDVLKIINFDILYDGFRCTFAVQPLYIPSDGVNLNCRRYINGIWGRGEVTDVERDLQQVMEVIEMEALPWFQSVRDPQGLLRFLQDEQKSLHFLPTFNPIHKAQARGFSHLYLGELTAGVEELKIALDGAKDDMRDWVMQWKQMIQDTISAAETSYEAVRLKLTENTTFTKNSIGI